MTKLTMLSEAVSQFIHNGDIVYAAGFTHLILLRLGMKSSASKSGS